MAARTAGQFRLTRARIAASVVSGGHHPRTTGLPSSPTADPVEGATSSPDLVVSAAQRTGGSR